MHLFNRIVRAGLIVVVVASVALLADTTGAFAATTGKSAGAPAAAKNPAGGALPALAPKGCNSNNFCSYNAGNGGSLCFQTSGSEADWPAACKDHNDGAYNRNGNSVNLYYLVGFSGAYSTLYSGNYWLYMSKNHFTTCGNSCVGQGSVMQNNVESHHFN